MPITAAGADQQSERASHPGRGRPHWRFTAPAVLVLLTDGPAHGYELLNRLRPMFPRNTGPPDASGLYRLLHRLEAEGSLRSSWASSGPGPARRVYELTDSGRAVLDGWGPVIASEIEALSGLLAVFWGATTEHPLSQANG